MVAAKLPLNKRRFLWGGLSPDVVVAGWFVVVVVVGLGLKLVKFALNPFAFNLWSDLKRTTIVLPLDSTGFGVVLPQNLPLKKKKQLQDRNRLFIYFTLNS